MPSGFRAADSSFDAAFASLALRLFKSPTWTKHEEQVKELTYNRKCEPIISSTIQVVIFIYSYTNICKKFTYVWHSK